MADTHLRDSQYQMRLRGQDFTAAMNAACRMAKARGADVILHAGDLLDTLRPSARTVHDLRTIHENLIADEMTMLVIRGNHDFTEPAWPEVIADECEGPGCYGLQNFDNRSHVIEKNGHVLRIHGLPFMQRQALIEHMTMVHADILMWHGMVREFVGYPLGDDCDVVSVDDFPRGRYQLVALGDIHVPAIHVHYGTQFIYPGSTELCSRGEPLEKGFYLHTFEAEDGQPMRLVDTEFVPIPNRRKIAMHVGSEEDLAEVIRVVRDALPEQPLVMVTFHRDFADTPKRLAAAIDTTRCILRVSMKASAATQGEVERESIARMSMLDFLPRFLHPGSELFQLGQLMIDPRIDAHQALESYVEKALEGK